MTSKQILLSLGCAIVALAGGVSAQSTPQDKMPPHGSMPHATSPAAPTAPAGLNMTTEETEVIDKLHAADMTEIAAGKLATQNGASSGVKNYGEMLVQDHTKADRELTALAKRNGIKLAEVDTAAKLDQLKGLHGKDFDHAFLAMMVKDHRDAVTMVRTAQSRAQNPDVQVLLAKVLPILQHHEQRAQQLESRS